MFSCQLRAVTPGDLERYMKYSSYVQILDISNDSDATCQVLEKADRFIFQLRLNDHHFAKLWSLTLTPCRLMESQNYLMIRGNNVVKSLKVVLDNLVRNSWLEAVRWYYSGISTLEIRSMDSIIEGTSLKPDFSIVLDGLVCLQVLKIDVGLDTIYTLLLKIRSLPRLEKLCLRLPEDVPEDYLFSEELALQPALQPRTGLRLEYEGLYGKGLSTILGISSSLSIFYWNVHCISMPVALPEYMETLLRWMTSNYSRVQVLIFSDSLRPLQQVVDNGLRRNINPQSALAIKTSTLSLLAGFSKLKALRLDTFWGSVLSPELLDTLARSLKLLTSCSFKTYRLIDNERNPISFIKLPHVIKFALQCANLRDLAVCCDARESNNPLPDLAIIAESGSKLNVLNVGQSMVDDAEYVVKALRTSLPSLHQVIYPDLELESGVYTSLLMTRDEMEIWRNVGRTIAEMAPIAPM